MAEPSMPTAHTSGSARCVRRRHQRVAPAPMATPRKPVKQVMAPKMRLWGQRTVGVGALRGRPRLGQRGRRPPPPPRPGPTCPWPHRAGCCMSLPSSARLGRGAGTAGSTCPGPLWRRTRPTWPGRRRRSCGWGEARAATLSGAQDPRSWPRRQPFVPYSFPRDRRPLMSSLTGSRHEAYGCRNTNTSSQNIAPSTVGRRDSKGFGQGCWLGRLAGCPLASAHLPLPTRPLPAVLTCGSGPSCLGAMRSAP